ncbi:2TM domain-containing protein [Aquimarina sp. 2201CG1-2-11]|uniref:2TM domain-containing protein n=1 Tax=Aquimarina discodermiae TaxID=3231043 RepID=UPI003462040C
MKDFDQEKKYQRARERVEELKKFYNKLSSYVIVIALLAGLNYYQNEWRYAWFLWPAFFWGIGLMFHAIKAFRINPMFKNWEERKIRKFMEEEQDKEKQLWE